MLVLVMDKLSSRAGRPKGKKMTPTTGKTEKVTSTVFDLDSMSEVTLIKNVEFAPVANTQEALHRVGNDAAKFLAIINDGLRQHVRESAKSDNSIPWLFEDEESGETTAFAGTPADMKAVNSLKLTLAKTIFGYNKDSDVEQKRAAKESALKMIAGNEDIRKGLKENAAA
jgi:hypothetical protein